MAKKGSVKDAAHSFCGVTEEDCKKMEDRYERMINPGGRGKVGGESGMRKIVSRCASFMKRCCAPTEETAAQTGEAHTK